MLPSALAPDGVPALPLTLAPVGALDAAPALGGAFAPDLRPALAGGVVIALAPALEGACGMALLPALADAAAPALLPDLACGMSAMPSSPIAASGGMFAVPLALPSGDTLALAGGDLSDDFAFAFGTDDSAAAGRFLLMSL